MSDGTMNDLEKYGDAWTRHLRIAILRALGDCNGKTASESLLVDMVQAVHIRADRNQVREQMVWLHGEGLVQAEITRGSLGATLVEAGEKIAEGLIIHPGVKRPNITAGVGRTILQLSLDSLKR